MADAVPALLRISPKLRDQAQQVFTSRRPFGPSSANGFRDYPDVERLAFRTENDVWKEYLTHPRMIVGRKGSGKTSVLKQTKDSRSYRIVHRVSTSDMIMQCIEALFEDKTDLRRVSAEQAGKVWNQIINTSLMTEFLRIEKNGEFPAIKRYFEVSGIASERDGRNLFTFFRNIPLAGGDSVATAVDVVIRSVLHLRGETGLEYEEALNEVDQYLAEHNRRVVVILDSVEEYYLDDHQFEAALKGFLRCAGAYGGRYRDLRVGIPAELYYDLRSKSANIAKDFDNAMVLHWSPMELLQVIAWRYLIFLSVYDDDKLRELKDVNLLDRQDVHRVLHDFLPVEIENRSGQKESSIAYVLRHTQLLPRQIIKIFNEAFSTSRPSAPQGSDAITNYLISSVQTLESKLCEEVYNAFAEKYPFASSLCRSCIPSLPRFFDESALERTYRQCGKRVLQEASRPGDISFAQFKEILFEIGAIGRVRRRTGMYADADFEYAMAGRLYTANADELCLHPAFSGTYETNSNRMSEHFVYPHMHLYESGHGRTLRL